MFLSFLDHFLQLEISRMTVNKNNKKQPHGMFLSQKHPHFEEFVAATKDGLIVYDASQIEDTDEGGVFR